VRAAFRRYLAPLHAADWVVFAKRPFAGPAQVLEYVGRYTHRVAISNNRLLSMDHSKVRFRWRDYCDGSRPKTMTLDAAADIGHSGRPPNLVRRAGSCPTGWCKNCCG
jgi:hypothetical protein